MGRRPEGVRPLRIGIFGGTFDPPHVGHVAVATDVADQLGLDRLLWIPAGSPPHKPPGGVTAATLRLEMVRRAAETDPRFAVSEVELARPGPSYTVDTLRALRERYPEAQLFLLLGADQVRELDRWKDPERVLSLARAAILDRAGESARATAPAIPGLERALHVPVRRVDVSSTGVRDAVRRGADWEASVPPAVADVVRREGLYREP